MMLRASTTSARRGFGFGLGLGATPNCPAGYYPTATCPNTTDWRVEMDPSGSGCQRCTALTAAYKSDGFCIQTLQYLLAQQGALSYGAATGAWNDETKRALVARLGSNWESYPGGACAIVASLQAGVLKPMTPYGVPAPGAPGPSYPGMPYPTQASMFGNIDPTLLLVGGAALLFFVLKR